MLRSICWRNFAPIWKRRTRRLTAPIADDPDLFSLLAELAALKNEVKLESKQVKQAYEQFRDVFDTLRQTNERLAAELARKPKDEQQTARTTERALLLELLDLRDRLHAGHDHAAGYQPNWLARLAKADEFVTGDDPRAGR